MNAIVPAEYSETARAEIADHVIEELSRGTRSLQRILEEDEGLCSSKTFYRWMDADLEMMTRVERAREIAAMKLIEEIPAIAEDVALEKNAIQKAKLRIYARESFAAKIAPKRFGAKLDLTSAGDKLPAAATDNRLQAIVGMVQQRKAKEISDGSVD